MKPVVKVTVGINDNRADCTTFLVDIECIKGTELTEHEKSMLTDNVKNLMNAIISMRTLPKV